MSIEFLDTHAKKLSGFAAETEQMSRAQPDNFFLKIAAKNQKAAALDAQKELAIAMAEQNSELVDLRLIGPIANGSISLDIFFNAMQPLLKAFKQAAYKISTGIESSLRIPEEISDSLNIKLAGLAPGSTHILITGNAQPDLTGHALFTESANSLFELLSSNNADFYEAVDLIGGKATQHISELMRALD